MKKIISLCLIVLFALTGCVNTNQAMNTGKKDKIKVVATLFPQYDFVRQVAGDRAEVSMLLNPGVDSHSFDPSPADIVKVSQADMFVYTGQAIETWTAKVLQSADTDNMYILDVSDRIEIDLDAEGHEDPHIWTSPVNAVIMVENIEKALCSVDSENAEYYQNNARMYIEQLRQLDESFRNVVNSASRQEIVFGSRFAMHYFVQEYGLTYYAAFDSCSAHTEPSTKAVSDLIAKMKEDKIPAVYYAELEEPKIAKTIADETGSEMLLFHSCHNVSKDEFDAGVTYLELMQKNVENLRKGLM